MIQPSMVGDVCEVLLILNIADMTVPEAQGFGRQNGHTMFSPDTGQSIDLSSKEKTEVF
jgi:nitrogen regulatory protein P-II 1/nitrogen regulatory protein P-II 2